MRCPASLLIRTIIWWCFAVGIDVATLESEEAPGVKKKKRKAVFHAVRVFDAKQLT